MLAGWAAVSIGMWEMDGSRNVDTGYADFVPFGIVVLIGCLTATAGSIVWLREMGMSAPSAARTRQWEAEKREAWTRGRYAGIGVGGGAVPHRRVALLRPLSFAPCLGLCPNTAH